MIRKSSKNKKWLVDSLCSFEPTDVVNTQQKTQLQDESFLVDKNNNTPAKNELKPENFTSNIFENLANGIKTQEYIGEKELDENKEFAPKIKVFGVGGAGNNVVDFILSKDSMVSFTNNVEFYALNTDKQHLLTLSNLPDRSKILINSPSTRGLGSGGDPKLGEQATLDFADNIKELLTDTDLCIVIAGVGKGTGTGGGPVVANIARDMNISTLAFVITPNNNEGNVAFSKARIGITNFQSAADAVATISNDLVDRNNNKSFSVKEIREQINKNIGLTVHSLVNIIVFPSYQNIDLADIKSFLRRKKNVNRLIHLNIVFDSNDGISKIQNIIDEKVKTCVYGQSLKMINKVLIQFNLNSDCNNELMKKVVSRIRELTGNADVEVITGLKFIDKTTNEQIDVFSVSPDLAASDIEEVHQSSMITRQEPTTDKSSNMQHSYTVKNMFDSANIENNLNTNNDFLKSKENITHLESNSIIKFRTQNDELSDPSAMHLESHSIIDDNSFNISGLETFDKDTGFDFDTDNVTKVTQTLLNTAIPRRHKVKLQFDDELLTFSETNFKN